MSERVCEIVIDSERLFDSVWECASEWWLRENTCVGVWESVRLITAALVVETIILMLNLFDKWLRHPLIKYDECYAKSYKTISP